MKTIETLAVT